MLSLKNVIRFFAVLICVTSCSKDEDYIPFHASAIHNGILISYTGADEKDMLLSEDIVSSISIKGQYSKKDIPFTIKSIIDGNSSRSYLSFNAELPSSNDMNFNVDKTEAYGESVVNLNICGKQIKLKCKFIYNCSNSETYGSNIIKLDSIECNGISMSEKANSQIIIELADLIGI